MNCKKFSPMRVFLVLIAFATFAAMAAAQTSFSGTPPTEVFQLNGDAAGPDSYGTCVYDTGVCDYWNLLNGDGTSGPNGVSKGHSQVNTFIDGTKSTDSFTTGGSKDFNDIPSWKWSMSPTPNKDTLNAGYAALYAGNHSDFVLTFGADRASPNGNANIGIWFFQQPISENPNGTFNGTHTPGDIFVISAFVGGGGTSAISVYTWDPTCAKGVKNPTPGQCADTNLMLRASDTSSTVCTASSPDCAITNSQPTTTTWEGQLASPLFFEGGINLNATLNVSALPCFSSFLEETRSSQSTSAVLKDFVLGQFTVCGMTITKTCDTGADGYGNVVGGGTQIHYAWKGTVQNTGIGTISNPSVTDYLPVSTSGAGQTTTGTSEILYTDTTYTTQVTSLGPGDYGYYHVSEDVAALSATNNASASATLGSTTINATNASGGPYATASCSGSVTSAVSVTKYCGNPYTTPASLPTQLNCNGTNCVVQVNFYAHVCNMGDNQLTNITLSDDPAATLSTSTISSLAPAGSPGGTDCTDVTGYYTPGAADVGTSPPKPPPYTFSDTIYVTGATGSLGTSPPAAGAALCPGGPTDLACSPATCPLCANGECPN